MARSRAPSSTMASVLRVLHALQDHYDLGLGGFPDAGGEEALHHPPSFRRVAVEGVLQDRRVEVAGESTVAFGQNLVLNHLVVSLLVICGERRRAPRRRPVRRWRISAPTGCPCRLGP